MPLVECPLCGEETEYNGNDFRPFCTERCKMIDLGQWADEEYALPAEDAGMTEEDLSKIEQALKAQDEQ